MASSMFDRSLCGSASCAAWSVHQIQQQKHGAKSLGSRHELAFLAVRLSGTRTKEPRPCLAEGPFADRSAGVTEQPTAGFVEAYRLSANAGWDHRFPGKSDSD